MLCSFNQCLQRNNIITMNAIQFLNEQIWFNRIFMYRGQCLHFKNWIDSGFIYVKDLFESTGKFESEKYVFECSKDKHNWLCEYVILKTTFKFCEEIFDCHTAPYIKSMTCNFFYINGERLHIDQLNTKIFNYNPYLPRVINRCKRQTLWEKTLKWYFREQHLQTKKPKKTFRFWISVNEKNMEFDFLFY